jgi:hypothetical protein
MSATYRRNMLDVVQLMRTEAKIFVTGYLRGRVGCYQDIFLIDMSKVLKHSWRDPIVAKMDTWVHHVCLVQSLTTYLHVMLSFCWLLVFGVHWQLRLTFGRIPIPQHANINSPLRRGQYIYHDVAEMILGEHISALGIRASGGMYY